MTSTSDRVFLDTNVFLVLTRKISQPLSILEAITVAQGVGKLDVVEIGLLAAGARFFSSEDMSAGQTLDTVTITNPFT